MSAQPAALPRIDGITGAEPAPIMILKSTMATAAFCIAALSHVSAISIASFGTTYTENFDSLASSGTSSALPAGWSFSESGTNANATYSAGTGSSNAGDTYSFGTDGDRALGTLQSGSLISLFGATFSNDTGGLLTSLAISYYGEEWRLGTAGRTDVLNFQYSLDATSITSGLWTSFSALDFVTPTTTTTGAKNGNDAANRTLVSSTIDGLTLAAGSSIWIRWTDFNASGADDGLAVDDFSLTAGGTLPSVDKVPESGGGGAILALAALFLVAFGRICRK